MFAQHLQNTITKIEKDQLENDDVSPSKKTVHE